MKRLIKRCFYVILVFIICATCFWNNQIPANAAKKSNVVSNGLVVSFLDVGQGDSAVIQCGGQTMMIDGGKAEASSFIYSWLKKNKVPYIDYMVATHADADHIGGLSGALNYAKVGKAYCSVSSANTKTFKSFQKYLGKQGKSLDVPKAGTTFKLGEAEVQVIGPVGENADSNNSSLVIRICYGDTSFLFTGDAEREEEEQLLSSGYPLESTVLKVGHHGSASSTSYLFLRTVSPSYAVISVGENNSYGHPTEEVLSRLRDADVKTYRTDMQGTITAVSDGKAVTFQVEKNPDAETLSGAGAGQKAQTVSKVPDGNSETTQSSSVQTYVLNTNTRKFHYPDCGSVSQMKDKNKKIVSETRDQIISEGYSPCGRCHP